MNGCSNVVRAEWRSCSSFWLAESFSETLKCLNCDILTGVPGDDFPTGFAILLLFETCQLYGHHAGDALLLTSSISLRTNQTNPVVAVTGTSTGTHMPPSGLFYFLFLDIELPSELQPPAEPFSVPPPLPRAFSAFLFWTKSPHRNPPLPLVWNLWSTVSTAYFPTTLDLNP